jgi:hypothetical protein
MSNALDVGAWDFIAEDSEFPPIIFQCMKGGTATQATKGNPLLVIAPTLQVLF